MTGFMIGNSDLEVCRSRWHGGGCSEYSDMLVGVLL
jgi:hypothetical protein